MPAGKEGGESDPVRVAARLKAELAKGAAERDRSERFPHAELIDLKQSGLLRLRVPPESGGLGADVGALVRVVSELAEADPNVAQMYVVHTAAVELINASEMPASSREEVYRRIAEDGHMFTNAYSEVGTRTVEDFRVRFTRDAGGGWRLNGRKYYCTGSLGGDLVCVLGITDELEPRSPDDTGPQFLIGLLDMDTPNVVVHDDWRAMGQRTTASGTIEFDDVLVPEERLFRAPHLSAVSLSGSQAQLMFSAIFLGIARAALQDAVGYARERTRPWIHSGVEKATEDPYVLMRVGEMRISVDAAEAVLARGVESWLNAEANLSPEARDQASVASAVAKVVTGDAALKVSEHLFQVCGAGAVAEKYDFGRHWRNARTLTLHDPADYKLRLVGDHVLNGASPPVSGYT
jgi:alkylation response protein AidB-like acyl-CoA dehydrogenase